MSNQKRTSAEDEDKDRDNKQPNSSKGDNSKSVTPKDVSSKDAAARDVTERKVHSADKDEKEEERLDDAVDLTFPASDPIAIPTPEDVAKRSPGRNA